MLTNFFDVSIILDKFYFEIRQCSPPFRRHRNIKNELRNFVTIEPKLNKNSICNEKKTKNTKAKLLTKRLELTMSTREMINYQH